MITSAAAQQTDFRENAVTFESGFFHRGLIGVSYTRHFLKREHTFFSASGFGGAGLYYALYIGGGADFNVGKGDVFFFTGVDLKALSPSIWEPEFNQYVYYFGWEPHIGMNVVSSWGLTGRMLFGCMLVQETPGSFEKIPTMGISLGCAF